MPIHPARERTFPLLKKEGYKRTSPETWDYNCIAFAADVIDEWWWPDSAGIGAWPKGAAREVKMEAFIEAYATKGYSVCSNDDTEEGFQKIAIYSLNGVPTHAAKQLPDGRWKSKLGPWEDIEHNTTKAVETSGGVGIYGEVKVFMKRPI